MEEVMSVQSGVRNYASVPELGYPLYRWPAVESVLEGHAVWGKADGTELVMAPSWRSPWMIRVFSSLGYKQSERKERDSSLASGLISNNKKQIVVLYFFSFFLPGCIAACGWFAPPSLCCVPCLSVCGVSRLSVCPSSGQFIRHAMDCFVITKDGADMLLKQRRKPKTHAVYLQTQGTTENQ